jgi:hypothetical protein
MSDELVPHESRLIERMFFTPLYRTSDAWSVIGWWESRRPFYNLCVGAAGLASLTSSFLLMPGNKPIGGMLAACAIYGVLANLCYSLGAPVDILLRKWLGKHAVSAGPVLLRYGFVFSLGLTLLPIPISIAIGILSRFFP